MQKTSRYNTALITSICFLAFFIFGFTDNLKGPTLPAMLAELNLKYGTGGDIFLGEYLGFLIATLLTGLIADKAGLKTVLLLAGAGLLLGVGGYGSFRSAILLSSSLFILGLGLGAFELGPNAIIVQLHHERKGLFLNLMSFMHGLGSMLAPLFASMLLTANYSWRIVYRLDLVLLVIFIVLTLMLRIPRPEEKTEIDFRHLSSIAFKRNLPLFYLAIGSYVAAEIGLATWLVTYLQQSRGASVISSNQSLSLFFATIMIGRLVGGFFVQRVGYMRSVLLASVGGLAFITLGLFTRISILLPLTGLFFSIIFPTLTAVVSDLYHENLNTILGIFFTFAGIGSLVGPWLMGRVSDLFALQVGFSLVVVFTALLLVSVALLLRATEVAEKK